MKYIIYYGIIVRRDRVLQYVKSPGLVYDLISIFSYKYFPEEYFIKTNIKDVTKLEKLINNMVGDEEFPEVFNPFFYLLDNNLRFITHYFLLKRMHHIIKSDGLSYVKSELKNNDIIDLLVKYLLKNNDLVFPVQDIYNIIYDSDLPNNIKLNLIVLYYNKERYIDNLCDCFTRVFIKLEIYYNSHISEIEKNRDDIEKTNIMKSLTDKSNVRTEGISNYIYSTSMLQDILLFTLKSDVEVFHIVGAAVRDTLKYLSIDSYNLDINTIGKIFSETSRIKALNLLKKSGEMSTTNIANECETQLSPMTQYLNHMANIGMLNYRNKGRTVFYSINYDYFEKLSINIKYFSVERGEGLL